MEVSTAATKNIFQTVEELGVSRFRFYLLRFFFIIIVALLGIEVWYKLFTHDTQWEPLPGVAYSFWASFSALAILGVLHPVKMIPLLLVQFSYKVIWLAIVAYPLFVQDNLMGSNAWGLTQTNLIGIILDLIVIPWPYVYRNLVLSSRSKS